MLYIDFARRNLIFPSWIFVLFTQVCFVFVFVFFCVYLALLAFESFFGHFFLGSQLAESEGEKLFDEVGVPLQIQSASIFPFSFPSYKSPDTKDDMVSLT